MTASRPEPLRFFGGDLGVMAPFVTFLSGVAWLGLSGAPDERGFWPVLLLALGVGLLLSRDRTRFTEEAIQAMSRPLVAIMILAWLLAGVLGRLLQEAGIVEALIQMAGDAGLRGSGYVGAAFLICCAFSTATGTSLGTVLVCGPLLYPAGGALAASPAILMGAILGGATFGDNISPISDTTIATSLTQEADIGGVVRSRLGYALAAAALALSAYLVLGGASGGSGPTPSVAGSYRSLVMLVVPVVVLGLLLKGRTLLEGLLAGIALAAAIGLASGLLRFSELIYIDSASYAARGLLIEGMERGIGASIFTVLLMGIVGPLEASGILDRLVEAASRHVRSPRGAEAAIVGSTTGAVLLTTHSVVAVLTVGNFARRTGERFGIGRYRRANLMDITVCVFPFILPYMIPTILAASTTPSGEEFGMPRLGPFPVGISNFHAFGLLVVLIVAVATGWGFGADVRADEPRVTSSASRSRSSRSKP
ncbi:MAG TPA: Na+/H+ antiporter NhaC family protein [Vicinamibacteria bacterium]